MERLTDDKLTAEEVEIGLEALDDIAHPVHKPTIDRRRLAVQAVWQAISAKRTRNHSAA